VGAGSKRRVPAYPDGRHRHEHHHEHVTFPGHRPSPYSAISAANGQWSARRFDRLGTVRVAAPGSVYARRIPGRNPRSAGRHPGLRFRGIPGSPANSSSSASHLKNCCRAPYWLLTYALLYRSSSAEGAASPTAGTLLGMFNCVSDRPIRAPEAGRRPGDAADAYTRIDREDGVLNV
jgi:hypothetical protein